MNVPAVPVFLLCTLFILFSCVCCIICIIRKQREALENALTNAEVLNVMGSAAKALKAAHNHMDVDQVHDLMDDIAEQQEVANEIAKAIKEQEELDKQLLDVGPAPVPAAAATAKLPDVPTAEPTKKKQEQQQEPLTSPHYTKEREIEYTDQQPKPADAQQIT